MKKSSRPFLFAAFLCLLLLLMLTHADYVTQGARNGLLLWYTSVVPALFPFMVLSGMIVSSGGISVLTAPFYFFLHPVLGLSRPGCYVLIAGLLCGYPMGAKTCADFIREGRISLSEGNFLMAVCNHPSPMFILGYVYPFFSNRIPLKVLLFSVYGPVLILAAAAMIFYPHGKNQVSQPGTDPQKIPLQPGAGPQEIPPLPGTGPQEQEIPSQPHTESADETILNAVEILCKIGGYLILFSIAIVFLQHTEKLPPFLGLFLVGSMEMTTGIRETATLLAFPLSGAAACAALTFGGFSGLFQTKAVIADEKKAGLSIRHYFLWKVFHSILSFLFFLLTVRYLQSPLLSL